MGCTTAVCTTINRARLAPGTGTSRARPPPFHPAGSASDGSRLAAARLQYGSQQHGASPRCCRATGMVQPLTRVSCVLNQQPSTTSAGVVQRQRTAAHTAAAQSIRAHALCAAVRCRAATCAGSARGCCRASACQRVQGLEQAAHVGCAQQYCSHGRRQATSPAGLQAILLMPQLVPAPGPGAASLESATISHQLRWSSRLLGWGFTWMAAMCLSPSQAPGCRAIAATAPITACAPTGGAQDCRQQRAGQSWQGAGRQPAASNAWTALLSKLTPLSPLKLRPCSAAIAIRRGRWRPQIAQPAGGHTGRRSPVHHPPSTMSTRAHGDAGAAACRERGCTTLCRCCS
jgi:hypothetical protein